MKKTISILLATVMILSLSVISFADTYIDYTFMDESTGYIYHFGRFDEGAEDAGLMVNGVKKTLLGGSYSGDGTYANAFEHADATENNLFGMGFMLADTYKGDSYTVQPYSTVAGVDTIGQEMTVKQSEYRIAELTSLALDNENVNLAWLDSENTYYKYLYNVETLPVVTATVNDTATVTIEQATIENPEAVITVTNKYDNAVSNTYKVKYVTADNRYSLKGDVKNFYSSKESSNSANTDVTLLRAMHVNGYNASYKTMMGFAQIDISGLPSDYTEGDQYILELMEMEVSLIDAALEKGCYAQVSLYDMTNDIDWTTDITDGTKSRNVTENISGKTPFAGFTSKTISLSDSASYLDITGFIKTCQEEDVTSPTIGLVVELIIPEGETFDTFARTRVKITNNNADYMRIYRITE